MSKNDKENNSDTMKGPNANNNNFLDPKETNDANTPSNFPLPEVSKENHHLQSSAPEDVEDDKDIAFVGYSEDDTVLVDTKLNTEIVETEEEKRQKKITALGKIIRRVTKESRVLKLEALYDDHRFNNPEEVESLFREMKEDEKYAEKYADIMIIKGSKATYLYSEKYMTTNFANIMIRLEDKDILTTVAETVRFDSKTYPRPTDSSAFFNYPYYIPKEEFPDIINGLANKPEFKDIHNFTASNGQIYLYSDLSMPHQRAVSLAEFEIYRVLNP